MQRTVSAQLALRVDDDATLAFIVAVAGRPATERARPPFRRRCRSARAR